MLFDKISQAAKDNNEEWKKACLYLTNIFRTGEFRLPLKSD